MATTDYYTSTSTAGQVVMLQIFQDGIVILYNNLSAILAVLFAALGLGLIGTRLMGGKNLSPEARIFGALPLGFLLLVPVAFLLMVAGYFVPAILKPGSLLILAVSCGLLIYERWRGELQMNRQIVIGAFSLLGLLVLRLAYLNYTPLPAYSDSTVHYEIVSSFLNPASEAEIRQPLANLFNNYYHYGFHSITAWLSLTGGISIERSMLLVGQLTLVILPISIFMLAEAITGSKYAAVTGAVLAAIGWVMPAFTVNWGKYPALCAVMVAPALVAVLLKQPREGYRKPAVILTAMWLITGSALLHTRILLCLVFAAMAILAANKLEYRTSLSLPQGTRLGIIFLVSLFPLYGVITEFYAGMPLLVILLFMLPFMFYRFPKAGTGIFFFVLLLWLALNLPTFFIRRLQPMLDQQFISMILFIPLSLVGGMGFAGVMNYIPAERAWRWAAPVVMALAVLFNFNPQALKPDLKAMEWIRANTPEDSLFLISAHGGRWRNVGSDAGIWIHPLTGRATNKLSYESNWSSTAQIQSVCGLGAKNAFLYEGGRLDSFHVGRGETNPALKLVYQGRDTAIFQVVACHDAKFE
jgi:hypothetical protein